jgi:glutamine synthetase
VLRRALSKAGDLGFAFYTHPEIEFFLLRDRPTDGSEPQPIDTGGYFDMTSHDTAHDFRRAAVTALESMGISVEFSHHEIGPGQQEIDLRYADALTMADNIMAFRQVIKEVAIARGVHATFMPKPFMHQPGSGMHTHVSLFEGDRNAFHDPTDVLNLSKTARAFIAGLLRHAREITAVTNQWVNSLQAAVRLRRSRRARRSADLRLLGTPNRSALVRVPLYKPGKANATRVELRSIDSACNPYLAFAVVLAAGLTGIAENYELPPGAEDDVWALSDTERRALGYTELPHNLADALRAMEESDLVAATLGEGVFEFFLRNKRAEWVDYRAEVTPFELRRYLPFL